MYEKCNTDGLIFSSLFTNKNDLLTMYDVDKKITTFGDYCKSNIGSTQYQIKCVNFQDNSNITTDSKDGDYIKDNSNSFLSKNVLMCDDLLVSTDSTDDKYTLIHGYNDICDNENIFNCGTKESFVSSYNPKLHRLDKNVNTIDFINTLTPKENKIIQNAINSSDNNLSNKLKHISNTEDIKQIYLEYLSNSKSYSSIINSINEMNKGATEYLYQESSQLIDKINRTNGIFDYNYHYGLSFWIYFDPEMLKGGNISREGLILNYAYAPYIYYDYETKNIIIELNDCDTKMILNKSDIVCNKRKIIYKSNDILFQRWNHFVVNYNYGTLDIFINNNMVATEKNVSPYIQTDDNSLQFGSNEKPLKNCGLCNVRYYNIPLNLNQIKNIYGNKDNPCK